MPTFCERLKPYYLQSRSYTYCAVEPRPKRRSDFADYQVDVRASYEEHKINEVVQRQLDGLITTEMHAKLVADGPFDAEYFKMRGFKVLKGRDSRVLTHPSLPNHLIKTSVQTRYFRWKIIPQRQPMQAPMQSTNLLRAHGHNYYETNNSNKEDFSLPGEYLYKSPHANQSDALHRQYYAISEKAEVYSRRKSDQIVSGLNSQEQRDVAEKVCTFIKETGITDVHAGNLLVTKNKENLHFTLIDQEPLLLYVEKSDSGSEQFLYNTEDRALIGLINFRNAYCRQHQLTEMALYVDEQIVAHLSENENIEVRQNAAFTDTYYYADWTTYALILITIPFFFIILPLFALHAYCTAPSRYQLA